MNRALLTTFLIGALLTSCTTTTKMTIYGTPGTKIYSPSERMIGTINSKGSLKYEIDDDTYYAFLLAQEGDGPLVPLGLNYKESSHIGASITECVCAVGAVIGVTSLALGVVAASAAEDDEMAGTFATIGAGLTIPCTFTGMAATGRKQQTSYLYRYKYLSKQSTNNDLQFTKAYFKEPLRAELVSDKPVVRQEHDSEKDAEVNSSIASRKSKTSNVTNRKLTIEKVTGVYHGKGSILKGNNTIETLDNIDIKIAINSDGKAVITILENGEEFFNKPLIYVMDTNSNNSITLKIAEIPSAIINIDKSGNLDFNHPKVRMDDDIYLLKISAKK